MLTKTVLKHWLQEVQPQVRTRTFQRYEEIVYQHLLPMIGDIKIRRLTEQSIQEYITFLYSYGNRKTDSGLSDSSVSQIVGVLKQGLKYAVKNNLIKYNPAVEIIIKRGQRTIIAFSEQEQKKIENFIIKKHTPRHYGILISLYTGLRIGEMLALTWADVDMRNCIFHVNKTVSPIKITTEKAVYVSPQTKTEAGNRIVLFPQNLIPFLREMRAQGRQYVVSSYSGQPVMLNSYQRTFNIILKKLKIPHKGFHALRHTFATRAIETGADMKTLSEVLGHSTPKITMERYVHSS